MPRTINTAELQAVAADFVATGDARGSNPAEAGGWAAVGAAAAELRDALYPLIDDPNVLDLHAQLAQLAGLVQGAELTEGDPSTALTVARLTWSRVSATSLYVGGRPVALVP